VYSSTNPEKLSLTVKAVLTGIIPYVIVLSGLTHTAINSSELNDVVATVAMTIQYGLTFVAAILGAYGTIRKVYLTATGQNPVVQDTSL